MSVVEIDISVGISNKRSLIQGISAHRKKLIMEGLGERGREKTVGF